MKKALAVFLTLLMLVSALAGCGAKKQTYPQAAKEEIFTKTVHDFEGLEVESLTGQDDTNFVVYAENVKQITVSEETNTLLVANYEDLVYTFANADETLKSLKKGDILFAKATAENPEMVAAKVKRVKKQGDMLLVYSDEIGLADLFVYADVLMDVSPEESADVTGTGHSGKAQTGAYVTAAAYTPGGSARISNLASATLPVNDSFSSNISIKSGNTEVTGSASVTLNTVTLEFRFSREHMQLFCGIWCDYETGNDVTLSVSGDLVDKTLTLGTARFLVGIVPVKLDANINVKVSGELSGSVSHTETKQLGFTTSVGAQGVHAEPIDKVLSPAQISGELGTAEGSVSVEFELKPSLQFGFIGSIYGSAYMGFEATASLTLLEIPAQEEYPDSIHSCSKCVDGDVNLVAGVRCGLELGIVFSAEDKEQISKYVQELIEKDKEQLDKTELSVILLEEKLKFADFYLSFGDAEPPFGWGECPNVRYKTTVNVQTKDKQPAAEAKLSAVLPDGTVERLSTGQDGAAILYLPTGETHFVSTHGIQYDSRDITVEQAPTNANILLHDRKLSITIGCQNKGTEERYPAQSAFPEMYELFYQQYPDADFTASLDLTDGDINVLVVLTYQEEVYGFMGSEELIMTSPYTCFEVLANEYRTNELDSLDICYGSYISRDWHVKRVIGDSPSLWWFDEGSPHWDMESYILIRDIDGDGLIFEEVPEEELITGYTYVYEFLSDQEYCHNRLLQFAPTVFPYIDAMMEGRLEEMVSTLGQ